MAAAAAKNDAKEPAVNQDELPPSLVPKIAIVNNEKARTSEAIICITGDVRASNAIVLIC